MHHFFAKPFWSSIVILLFLLPSCKLATEQLAAAKAHAKPDSEMGGPVGLVPAREYTSVTLSFTDTNSKECRAMTARLDSFYHKQIAIGFNGSVLVGYKGKIMYERYYGYANKSKGLMLSKNTPSQLASTSKPFTATAVLLLYQNHYLDINAPVQKYLKDFPYDNITVKMLLCHRSGLPDYTHFALDYWKDKNAVMYNEDLLQILHQYKPKLNSTPNSRFQYSNTNFAMLARIIEEVTQMHYKDFMRDFIFKPLGMKHTYVYDPADPVNPNQTISYKYNWSQDPFMFADGVYGDKGIYSTVEDMYLWDQSFYNHKLLNEKTLQLAYTPTSFERGGVKNYGLGWRMFNYPDGYKIIYHNGWWHGNNTVFYRFIKDDLTIIVLGNRFNNKIYSQAQSVYNIIRESSIDNSNMSWENAANEDTNGAD